MESNKIYLIQYDNQMKQSICKSINNKNYIFKMSIQKIVETLCIMHGSTLQGRYIAFSKLTQIMRKRPIFVSRELFLIPLISLKNEHCVLVNYHLLVKIRKINHHQTLLCFKDGLETTVNFNDRIIKRQKKLCEYYLSKINKIESFLHFKNGIIQKEVNV